MCLCTNCTSVHIIYNNTLFGWLFLYHLRFCCLFIYFFFLSSCYHFFFFPFHFCFTLWDDNLPTTKRSARAFFLFFSSSGHPKNPPEKKKKSRRAQETINIWREMLRNVAAIARLYLVRPTGRPDDVCHQRPRDLVITDLLDYINTKEFSFFSSHPYSKLYPSTSYFEPLVLFDF